MPHPWPQRSTTAIIQICTPQPLTPASTAMGIQIVTPQPLAPALTAAGIQIVTPQPPAPTVIQEKQERRPLSQPHPNLWQRPPLISPHCLPASVGPHQPPRTLCPQLRCLPRPPTTPCPRLTTPPRTRISRGHQAANLAIIRHHPRPPSPTCLTLPRVVHLKKRRSRRGERHHTGAT